MRAGSPEAFLLVAAGGAAGGLLRYGAVQLFAEPTIGFGWTTWTVNGVGCLALGFLVAGVLPTDEHTWLRPALGTGLVGGFTTFSAVAQTTQVTAFSNSPTALAYLLGSVAIGLLGVLTGTALGARWSVLRAERHPHHELPPDIEEGLP